MARIYSEQIQNLKKMKTKNKIEYAVEYRKGTKWNQRPGALYKYMECKVCGQFTQVGDDVLATTCNDCVSEGMYKQFGGPSVQSNKPSGFHRGWRWMKEFVHADGRVFHKGVEQIELKGTLPPTQVKQRLKLKAKQKEDVKRKASVKVHKLKKELDKARWKKDKKVILREIRYYSRIMNGKISQEVIEKYNEGNFLSS